MAGIIFLMRFEHDRLFFAKELLHKGAIDFLYASCYHRLYKTGFTRFLCFYAYEQRIAPPSTAIPGIGQ